MWDVHKQSCNRRNNISAKMRGVDLKIKCLENECTISAAFVATASDDNRICKDNYLCETNIV